MNSIFDCIGPYNFSICKVLDRTLLFLLMLLSALVFQTGCESPAGYRAQIDKAAADIISEKQLEATGRVSEFTIERPSNILRRRLFMDQNLPTSAEVYLGTDKLKKIEHWPEKDYPAESLGGGPLESNDINEPLRLSLVEALQVGARNSFEYQNQKEQVFKSALALELERDVFRNTFTGQVKNLTSTNSIGERTVSGTVTSGSVGVSRKLYSGASLSTAIAVDLANLFTMGGASSLGLAGDATVSIPLLRGSGRHIVTEPLTQAERDVVYAMWNFEQFKKEFAVDVASRYLSVLQQLDSIKNSEADYRSRIASVRRSRRLADAGRVKEIEVDQAVTNELRARQRWIGAMQSYKNQLDSFKSFLGCPPDSIIELDPKELELLVAPTKQIVSQIADEDKLGGNVQVPPADVPVELEQPTEEGAGPFEIDQTAAIRLAFDNRLDLRTTQGRVYDAQRTVVVAADALGAELTFLGSAGLGGARRTISDAGQDDAHIRVDEGVYSTLLTLNLPFERTKESINYRNSFIALEQAVRDVQILEDRIRTQLRNILRDMLEARENMYIQAKAVFVAEKRVKSVNMFLEAGRAQTRDLLEAQDALLSAQNELTGAVVNYRTAEWAIQRDIGVLEVDEKGLWKEYQHGEKQDVKEEIYNN